MVWQPAEGGEGVSAEQYSTPAEAEAGAAGEPAGTGPSPQPEETSA